MRIKLILPKVIHIDFDTPVQMAKALGRVQEYAENPKLAGTVFSWARLQKLCPYPKGYFKSVLGMNIPSSAFIPFRDGSFGCLTSSEKAVLRDLDVALLEWGIEGTYYVISSADGAAIKDRNEALDHEIAHGLWFTNPEYRAKALDIINDYPEKETVIRKLRKWGIYSESVLEDEMHAYFGTDSSAVLIGRFRMEPSEDLFRAHEGLKALLRKYKDSPNLS